MLQCSCISALPLSSPAQLARVPTQNAICSHHHRQISTSSPNRPPFNSSVHRQPRLSNRSKHPYIHTTRANSTSQTIGPIYPEPTSSFSPSTARLSPPRTQAHSASYSSKLSPFSSSTSLLNRRLQSYLYDEFVSTCYSFCSSSFLLSSRAISPLPFPVQLGTSC